MGNNTKYSELNNLVAAINVKLGGSYLYLAKVPNSYELLLNKTKIADSNLLNWLVEATGQKEYREMFNYLSGILHGLKL